jgi:tRNA pseudouridine55 synthase
MSGGLILIDKPAGMSSAKVVSIVKHKLKVKKIGHLGTLDPFATGLLVCLTGRATKLAGIGLSGDKEYEGVFRFGVTTSTDDSTGEILRETRGEVSLSELKSIVSSKFLGEIKQIPPKVSAKHVGGERAYKLARQGIDFTLKPKTCRIYSFEILEAISPLTFSFRVSVSGGTYIRSLARDIGEILGLGGILQTLRRTKVGALSVAEAVNLDDVSESSILDWTKLVPSAPVFSVSKEVVRELSLGRPYEFDRGVPLGILRSDKAEGFVLNGTKVVLV